MIDNEIEMLIIQKKRLESKIEEIKKRIIKLQNHKINENKTKSHR